jgi:hypothetical protein
MKLKPPLSQVLVFLALCAYPVAAISAETPPLSAVTNAAPGRKPPLIINNPDGTMTVQKLPVPGKTENAAQKGLVIPPQIVVPTVRARADDRRDEAR